MKVTFLLSLSVIILGTIACASVLLPPRLQDRTLLIDANSASLIYPHVRDVCERPDRRFFKKCKKERIVEEYNLNDPETRRILIGAGFECKSKLQFQY